MEYHVLVLSHSMQVSDNFPILKHQQWQHMV